MFPPNCRQKYGIPQQVYQLKKGVENFMTCLQSVKITFCGLGGEAQVMQKNIDILHHALTDRVGGVENQMTELDTLVQTVL